MANGHAQVQRIRDTEATTLLLKVHLSREPRRFADLAARDWPPFPRDQPLPATVQTVLADSPACLLLLNEFLTPMWHYQADDRAIVDSCAFLQGYRTRIATVFERAPSAEIARTFMDRVVQYFRDPASYPRFHEFVTLVAVTASERQFLASFLDERVLFRPQRPAVRRRAPAVEDYREFLRAVGIEGSAADRGRLQPFEALMIEPEVLPVRSVSYRDAGLFVAGQTHTGATALVDMVLNRRFVNFGVTEAIGDDRERTFVRMCERAATEPMYQRDLAREKETAADKIVEKRWAASRAYPEAYACLCEATPLIIPHECLEESIQKMERIARRSLSPIPDRLIPIVHAAGQAVATGVSRAVAVTVDQARHFCRYHRAFVREFRYRHFMRPPPSLAHCAVDWSRLLGERVEECAAILRLPTARSDDAVIIQFMRTAIAELETHMRSHRPRHGDGVVLRRVCRNAVEVTPEEGA
jgi:hypothetical protein